MCTTPHSLLRSLSTCCAQIMTTDAGTLPLDRIFIKQRLDLLTARAWLDDDAKLGVKVCNPANAPTAPVHPNQMARWSVVHAYPTSSYPCRGPSPMWL